VLVKVSNCREGEGADQSKSKKPVILFLGGNALEFVVEGSAVSLEDCEREEHGGEAEDPIVKGLADYVAYHWKDWVGAVHCLIRTRLIEHAQEGHCHGEAPQECEVSQGDGDGAVNIDDERVGLHSHNIILLLGLWVGCGLRYQRLVVRNE